MQAPIGVFDSGVGGVTVLSALQAALPHEDFVYIGDTARVPYGNKPPELVTDFALQIGKYLEALPVKAIVIACNSAAAVAREKLRAASTVPVYGVVGATVQAALAHAHTHVGVIGTGATIKSEAYQKPLQAAGRTVWAKDCPMFVPLVEEGVWNDPIAPLVANHYLQDAPTDMESLILACTHYPFLKAAIGQVLPKVTLVDSAHATAEHVKADLTAQNLLSTGPNPGTTRYLASGDPQMFAYTAQRLGLNIPHVQKWVA